MHPGVESRACYLRRVLLVLTACLRPCSPSLSLRKFPRCETNSERRFRRHSAFNPTASHARARRATALQFVTPLSRSANAKTARSALGLDMIIPLSAHRRTHCLAKALNLCRARDPRFLREMGDEERMRNSGRKLRIGASAAMGAVALAIVAVVSSSTPLVVRPNCYNRFLCISPGLVMFLLLIGGLWPQGPQPRAPRTASQTAASVPGVVSGVWTALTSPDYIHRRQCLLAHRRQSAGAGW